MTGSERDGGLPDATQAAWLVVSDDLLAGVAHALNNRVAALTAVAQVLAATTEGPLSGALGVESNRLQQTVQLLRLLVRRWGSEAEPVQVQDVLSDAAELLGHHPDHRYTELRPEVDPAVPPIWGERSSLTHAFCLLLALAAEAAERGGGQAVPVRCFGTPEEVRVEIPVASSAGNPAPRLGPAQVADAANGLLGSAGGRVETKEEAGEITGLVVLLPTLSEIRRREREAGSR